MFASGLSSVSLFVYFFMFCYECLMFYYEFVCLWVVLCRVFVCVYGRICVRARVSPPSAISDTIVVVVFNGRPSDPDS